MSLKIKLTVLFLTIFTIFSKTDKILGEIPENVNKNIGNASIIHETSTIDNSLWNTKLKKIFFIPYSTLEVLFNDTTHNSVRWIYRSVKIVWTKKNPFEYIVPAPQEDRNK